MCLTLPALGTVLYKLCFQPGLKAITFTWTFVYSSSCTENCMCSSYGVPHIACSHSSIYDDLYLLHTFGNFTDVSFGGLREAEEGGQFPIDSAPPHHALRTFHFCTFYCPLYHLVRTSLQNKLAAVDNSTACEDMSTK